MTALTNTAIDAMQKGDRLKDDRVRGLSVVRNTDNTSFLLYYRTKLGVERRPKIGDYGSLTIARARDIARSILAEVAAGRDPAVDRDAARNAPTMDDLWKRCELEHYNRGKTWDDHAKSFYERHVSPVIGKERVAALTYDDVQRVQAKLRDMPAAANRVIAVLTKMLNLAERWGLRPLGSNPTRHLKRFSERQRGRYATPDELGKIIPVLERHGMSNSHDYSAAIAFIYLLLYTGARPSEIENGTSDMVETVEHDGKPVGVLRLDEGKTGQRAVFLPAQAMNAMARLPKDRKTLTGLTRLPRKFWEKVREEAGCPDLWARDLRRTFATTALSNGVAIGQVGELLGHKSAQTTKIYAKLMQTPALAAAAITADRLDAMIEEARPKVDPFA